MCSLGILQRFPSKSISDHSAKINGAVRKNMSAISFVASRVSGVHWYISICLSNSGNSAGSIRAKFFTLCERRKSDGRVAAKTLLSM